MGKKKPFSGKQKKAQLAEKKSRRRAAAEARNDSDDDLFGTFALTPAADTSNPNRTDGSAGEYGDPNDAAAAAVEPEPGSGDPHDSAGTRTRFALLLTKESKEEIQRRIRLSQLPLEPRSPSSVRMALEGLHAGKTEKFLVRPSWDRTTTAAQLAHAEEAALDRYVHDLHAESVAHGRAGPSYFEANIETWRQLWHVLDRSDVLFYVVDVRFAALHFSPALYNYATTELKRRIVLVLNKCDLVEDAVAEAWAAYFTRKFPLMLVVSFRNFEATTSKKVHRRPLRLAIGMDQVLAVWRTLGFPGADEWERMLAERSAEEQERGARTERRGRTMQDGEELGAAEAEAEANDTESPDVVSAGTGPSAAALPVTTIGLIGQPNVGKSTVLNALMGRKVVQVSITPGRTKRFQTHYMTPQIVLCDCPGLVLPTVAPKALQVLAGVYPSPQLREPYTAVQYVAERIDLVEALRLTMPDSLADQHPDAAQWSAFAICEAYAERRRYMLARAGRPDTHRAGVEIVKLVVEGKINFFLRPPEDPEEPEEFVTTVD